MLVRAVFFRAFRASGSEASGFSSLGLLANFFRAFRAGSWADSGWFGLCSKSKEGTKVNNKNPIFEETPFINTPFKWIAAKNRWN